MSWRETQETLEQFGSCWEGLEDPRTSNATLYDFHELLIIALCSVLCGGQGPTYMAIFAEERVLSSRLSQLEARCAQTRRLQPTVPGSGRGSVSRCIPAVYGPVLRAGARRGGCGWQGSAPVVRSGQRQVALAHGQCVGLGTAAGVGAGGYRCQIEG